MLAFDKVSKDDQIKYSKMAQDLDWNVFRTIEKIFDVKKG
jgi:hypothetical protein